MPSIMGVARRVVALGLCSVAASAASLIWDATNTTAGVQEGVGNWTINATDTNWWNGSANVAWNNANGDIAVFGSNTAQNFSTQFRVTNTVDMTLGGILFNQSYLVGVVGGSQLIFNDGSVITNASTNNTTLANISAPVFTTGTVYRTGNRINWFNTSFNGGGTLVESTVNSDLFNNTNSFGGLSAIVMTNTTAQLDLRVNGVFAGGGTGPVLRIFGTGGIIIQSLGGNGADWHGDIQLPTVANATMTGSANNGTTPSVLTLSGNISGAGGLALSGLNWGIVLSGSNSYANGTTISVGNVTFANTNALPASGLITIAGGSLIATGALNSVTAWLGSGRIATNGSWGGIALGASEDVTLGAYSNLFVGAAGVVNYTNTLNPGGPTYRLGGGGGTLIFGQMLSGATSLVVGPTNGVGAVLMANTANSFSGGTTLNTGNTTGNGPMGNILLLGADNVLGTGRVTLNGGVLASDTAATRTLTNAVTLAGNLQIGQYSPAFGGSNGNITLSGPMNLSGGRTLNLTNAATTLLISGVVTNTGSITKNGPGTLALNNPGNTYSGGTTLNTGTLSLGADNVLGSGLLNLIGGVLASDGAAARTQTNGVTVQASFQFGNTAGTGALTLAGVINLGNSAKTLTISNSITTFSNTITNNAALLKSGPGTLVLMGANSTFSGTTNLAGVLALGNDNVLSTGTVALSSGTLASDGAATRTLSNAITVVANTTLGQVSGGTGQLILSGPVYNGTISKTWTVNNPTTLVSGAISGTSSSTLTKTGPGLLIFSGANTYTGSTVIAAGALQFGSLGAIGGTGVSVTNSAIVAFDFADVQSGLARLGTLTAGTVAITSAGSGSPIDFSTPGLSNVWLGAMGTVTYDLGNLTPFTPGVYKLGGGLGTLVITNLIAGSCSLNIGGSGSGNVLLTTNNTFTGGTVIQGNLTLGTDNALPTSGVVTLGGGIGSARAGTLDLNGHNQTLQQLLVSSESILATNLIVVGVGQTLTLNGGFTNGYLNTGTTMLTLQGGGNWTVNSSNASFQLGFSTNGTALNSSTVNMGALGTFTANLGTGTLRLGETVGSSSVASNLLVLATNSTITARTLGLGDKIPAAVSGLNTLSLGAGTNALYVDAVYVGGGKDNSLMNFAGTTGILTLSNSAGTGRANLTVGVNTIGTGLSQTGTLDTRGHYASLYLGSVTNGGRIAGSAGNGAGNIFFDQGVLNITNLLMGIKTASSSGTVTSVLSIGGGLANIGPTLLATNAVNFTTPVTALLDFAGGTITMGGNIAKGGGVGPTTATLQMTNTATLDMAGFKIGSAALPLDVVLLQAGTLKNVGELNGGTTPLTKTGSGLLVLDGNNTYTGGTTISNGTLQVGTGGASGTLGSGTVNNLGTLLLNRSDLLTLNNMLTGNGTMIQNGGGTVNLTGDGSAYGGSTLVSNGTLLANGTLGGLISVYTGGTLGGTGALNTVAINGGTLSPGNSPGIQLVANLTLSGGTLRAELVNSNSFDQVIVTNALTFTTGTTNLLHLALTGFTSEAGASYLIVRNDSATPWDGTSIFFLSDLSGDNGLALTNGMVFQAMGETATTNLFRINYDFIGSGDAVANDVVLTVIPEPASLNLLLLLGAAYGLRRSLRARRYR